MFRDWEAPRKIVQITMSQSASFTMLYALCDDGTLWYLSSSDPRRWKRETPIPQDD